jgi:hypothetical protein
MTFTPLDVAWAAGLFEGEGSFVFYATKTSKRRITASLTTTDEDVIRKFCSVVGLGVIYGPRCIGTNKPFWQWTTTTFEDTQAIVALFWRWLGARRKEKAKEVIHQYLAVNVRFHKPFKLASRHSKQDAVAMRALAAKGVLQADIAKQFNRSPSSVSRILSGGRKAG